MPYANEAGKLKNQFYVYMEPLVKPEDTPYFIMSEYDRPDMILVHTFDLEFTPDLTQGFTVPASLEKLRARAASFMDMAATQQEAIENLLALPAPCDPTPQEQEKALLKEAREAAVERANRQAEEAACDHTWLTLPNGTDECTQCHAEATQADMDAYNAPDDSDVPF